MQNSFGDLYLIFYLLHVKSQSIIIKFLGMNKTQINKLRMFVAVDLVLKNHSELFESLAPLVLGHQRLKDGLLQLEANRLVQEANNTGLTGSKTDLRTKLIDRLMKFMAALKAYAIATNNLELKEKVNYPKSKLVAAPDNILYDIGSLVVSLAMPILPELAKYLITTEKVTDLTTSLTNFKEAIPQKRVATSTSKVSTENIGDVINSLHTLLKEELDALMLLLEEDQPDFYKAYKNARLIVDYAGGGKSEPEEVPSTI